MTAAPMPPAQRYLRQTVLAEIGSEGQQRLASARVLVVGAGGLGSPVLAYLTAAGVGLAAHGGRIGIIDDDRVDLGNLQRQIIYGEEDRGAAKASTAARKLAALNSETGLVAIDQRLRADNALDILSGYQIIVDGSDNFASKYLINDAAVKLGLPVVYGSIVGLEGQAAVFWAKHGPCYRCLYPAAPRDHVPNCAEAGTLGGIAGLIGSLQAVETCKLALGLYHCRSHGLEPLLGRLWHCDARNWQTLHLAIAKSPACPVCRLPAEEIVLAEESENGAHCASVVGDLLTLAELEKMRDAGRKILLIDVRETHEWESQGLPGSRHLPLARLLGDPAALSGLDRSATIVTYCAHGIRSASATRHLRQNGYEAYSLAVDWRS